MIEKAYVGSKFVATAYMDSYEHERQKAMGNTFSFSAEGGAFGYSASAGTSHETNKSSDSKNMQSKTNASTYTIGSDLPGGANVAEKLKNWVANKAAIAKDPQPIGNYSLIPIEDFVKTALQKEEGWPIDMIDKIKSAMKSHLKTHYCNYLKSEGRLSSCKSPPKAKAINLVSQPKAPT